MNTVITDLANDLRKLLDSGKMVDVGRDAIELLGVKPSKMMKAVEKLTSEGYNRYYLVVHRDENGNALLIKVVTPPSMDFIDAVKLGASSAVRLERLSV